MGYSSAKLLPSLRRRTAMFLVRWSSWIIVAVAVFLLAACGGGQATPGPLPATSPDSTPSHTPTPVSTPTPAPTLQPDAETTPEPALPEELFLEVLEPADESVVNEVPLVVLGRTTPDAVVSVAGETAEVNAKGEFVKLLQLDEGPNFIEVVASDLSGNQENAVLAVIYFP